MIPKIIHYCWFGGKPLPEELQAYLRTWKKHMPGYTLKRWDESNLPPGSTHLNILIRHGKWAFVADYVRLYALYTEGGVYLDTDIEMLRPIDPLLDESCFIGFQQNGEIVDHSLNGAIIGAVPGHPYIKDCLELSLKSFYSQIKPLLLPCLMSRVAMSYGLSQYGDQMLRGVHLFGTEVFYPYHWLEKFTPECVTPQTYCIHRWQYSWNKRKDFKSRASHLIYKLRRVVFLGTTHWRKKPEI